MKQRTRRRTLARSRNRHFIAQVVTWRQQINASRRFGRFYILPSQ